jgi:hypothetical protein
MQVLSILPVKFVLADEVRRICSLFQNELRMYATTRTPTGRNEIIDCPFFESRKDITFSLQVGSSLATLGVYEACLDKASLSILLCSSHFPNLAEHRPDLHRVSVCPLRSSRHNKLREHHSVVTNLLSNAIKVCKNLPGRRIHADSLRNCFQFTDISPINHREIHLQLEVSIQAPKINTCLPPDASPHSSKGPYDGPIFVYVSVRGATAA